MKLIELFEAKLSASVRKQITARVKVVQDGDGAITWQDLYDEQNKADGKDSDFIDAVTAALQAWSFEAETEYQKFKVQVTAIEQDQSKKLKTDVYLFDENVDIENTLNSKRTRDSVDFWSAVLRASKFAVGTRSEEYAIDINKLLGRVIY